MIDRVDGILGKAALGLLCVVWFGATWLFGAWEQWWFWPFVALIFAATGCMALRLTLLPWAGPTAAPLNRLTGRLLAAYLPFLVYALIRVIQTDVRLDAERSFLLHLTPVLIAVTVMAATPPERHGRIVDVLTVSLALIGAYAIINHMVFRNARVLWMPGFPQYQLGYYRATGTYFCPDHFAGLMEIGLGLVLARLLSRSSSRRSHALAAAMGAVMLTGIVLSKSRGAAAVVAALMATALWLAPTHLPAGRRWAWRAAGLAALVLVLAGGAVFGGTYVKRFKEYPWHALQHSDRFQMSAAAFRAWQGAKAFGIGPGMHQNLWPHIAASPDGDRATGRWPTHLNNNFHSYEAHNDWIQLLEEYGVTGTALFLFGSGFAVVTLAAAWRRQLRRWREQAPELEAGADRLVLAALFAALAMGIHSIGDFNLQIPATTWLMGGLAGMALAAVGRDRPQRRRRRQASTSS